MLAENELEEEHSPPRKRVVIVGGGFGGLSAAKRLGRYGSVDVVLIDQKNFHLFQPLLYQVALAALSPADIAAPIRAILRKYDNLQVILARVVDVGLRERRVLTEAGAVHFDYLVLACGASHSYFGHPEWEEYAPGLKTVEQATEIRRRVLLAFELAEREADVVKQAKCLTFVIVGGGPTGVELAGAIAEISNKTLLHDFDHIDLSQTKVILVEAAKHILPMFPQRLAERATRDLEELGVKVMTGRAVTDVNAQGVTVGDEFIPCCTVVWAAGVKPSSLNEKLDCEKDRAGRIIVQPDLSLPGYPNVFVIGDQAHARDEKGSPLPGLAPVAMQQGRFVGDLITGEVQGRARPFFRYNDKGTMATIGRKRAIAMIGRKHLTGTVAWLAWLLIHIHFLIGFRNKVAVLAIWAWSYITNKRSARLIVDSGWRNRAEARQPKIRVPRQAG